MKIALDATLLGARFSGVERSVAQLLRALPQVASADTSFTLFVGRAFDDYVAAFHPTGFDPTGRLQVVQTGLDNTNRWARLWWQQMVLPRLVDQHNADLFHAPAYVCPVTMRAPHVVTLYDLISLERPEFTQRLNQWHYRLAVPAGVRRAQRVIVPSAATRRSVAKLLPTAYERTVTIPLGVEPRFFDVADAAQVRERFRLPERYYLWVGNVEPKKNVDVLLQALRLLKERGTKVPKLVLAGALSWGTQALMQTFLKEGLQRHVIFLGRVTDAELPALYHGATAFLFPSWAEGFGLPVLEAMAAGVPTVGSTAGSVPEVVGAAGLLAAPQDAAAWADAMVRLAEDAELRAELTAKGLAWAREFSWERTARETLAVYAAALSVGEDDYDHRTGRFLYAAQP